MEKVTDGRLAVNALTRFIAPDLPVGRTVLDAVIPGFAEAVVSSTGKVITVYFCCVGHVIILCIG